jgi:ornithine--oxo-acid transaminase
VTPTAAPIADVDDRALAHNYEPLPVNLVHGDGAWVRTEDGTAYLDMLSAYSALNFGHRHPRLVAVAHHQLDTLTLTSRAYSNDQIGPFARALAELCDMERVLPMNTGAEAIETAIKAARRWGYVRKGVPHDRANIVVFDGNFHGRTTTIIGMSSDPEAREGFGPFTPGFVRVPFGDASAVAAAIDDDTVAVLVEPIQGEAGVVVPPDGFLRALRGLCTSTGTLLIADEVQSGLGRTGRTFAFDHEEVRPDVYVLGKALGGGIVPLSAVVADGDVLDLLTPGSHGSTFGGNPLACAVGREVVAMLATGEVQERAARLGTKFLDDLDATVGPHVASLRGRGLWAAFDLPAGAPSGRAFCERLLTRQVLAKDTHGQTVRLAPPLVIDERDLDWGVEQIATVARDWA